MWGAAAAAKMVGGQRLRWSAAWEGGTEMTAAGMPPPAAQHCSKRILTATKRCASRHRPDHRGTVGEGERGWAGRGDRRDQARGGTSPTGGQVGEMRFVKGAKVHDTRKQNQVFVHQSRCAVLACSHHVWESTQRKKTKRTRRFSTDGPFGQQKCQTRETVTH